MSIPLLSTKLHIPHTRANGVLRQRLTRSLLDGIQRAGSLILISGPAGFGKTTLLSEFVEQFARPVAWVSLDEADNDPIRFWTYLISACQTIQPGVGESALALFQTPQPFSPEMIPTLLVNDLAAREGEHILILDDYHLIQNPAIHNALSFLLDHQPDHLHLILATRTDPPWPLARYRARNQSVEIRAADLRFTMPETADFLKRVMELDLSLEDVAALETRTEGWIAGLQLAGLSMRGRSDLSAFIQALSGSHVYVADYLIEEVLEHQSETVNTFLLQSSLLKRLNAGLCAAVTGCADSQAILKELYQANLFVLPLDDQGQWFRYHHLFADLLQARLPQSLSPEKIAALHQRAALWHAQAGLISDAMDHALAARDYALAVDLVEKNALPMILQAYVRTVESWLQALPADDVERSARVNMAQVWLNVLRGALAQAAPYLERLTGLFASPDAAYQEPSLLGEWLAIQSKLLGLQGKPAESRDLAQRALQILPEADAHVRSMLYVNLATAYQQMLDYDRAAEIFQAIVREAQSSGNFVVEILGISGRAQMVLQQGRLHLGFEIASQGIQRLDETGKSTPFGATLFGELGQIHYHWHQLDQSRASLDRSMQASGRSGYSDPEIYKHVMLSRMFQMEADWDSAAREMRNAADLARAIPPAMVREHLISQQIRVDLAFQRLEAAQVLLQAEGFDFNGAFQYPDLPAGSAVTDPLGLLYNSALRILLFQGRLDQDPQPLRQGIALASRVLDGELQCGHLPVALETLLLRGQMHAACGNDRDRLADVAQAVQLAEPEGFISIFVEEGQPIAEALTSLLTHHLPGNVPVGYLHDLLAAFPSTPSSTALPGHPPAHAPYPLDPSTVPIEPLTPRELEVLQLIAAGDSNQTIAGRLVITLSAVKKHAGNIFNKLNVDSRTQAISRARQLGLLAPDG